MDSSVFTMTHAVRGFFRLPHIDGLIVADPAVHARLPKVHRDESRTQGLDRLELIRSSRSLRPHRSPRGLGLPARNQRPQSIRSRSPADRGLRRDPSRPPSAAPGRRPTCPPPCRSLSQSCATWKPAADSAPAHQRTTVYSSLDRTRAIQSTAATSTGWSPESRRLPASQTTSARTPCGTPPSPTPLTQASTPRRPDPGPMRRPRISEHYDRARGNLDRHRVHFLTACVAGV